MHGVGQWILPASLIHWSIEFDGLRETLIPLRFGPIFIWPCTFYFGRFPVSQRLLLHTVECWVGKSHVVLCTFWEGEVAQ